MSAAKMKTTPSATVASTDVKERMRKQQQIQEHHQQQQDAKIGNRFVAPAATDATPTTSTSAATAAAAPPAPTKTLPTTSVETTNELQGAVGGRVGGGSGRRNRTKKMRSASGDDFKQPINKRRAAVNEKRHVNFLATNSKSVAGSSKLIKKSASSLKSTTETAPTTDANALTKVAKSKSILKVKQVVVLKRQADSGKVIKKLKKAPQGAQAETEAAELSKLAQQFTRTVPSEVGAADAQPLPTRSVSNEDGRRVSKKNRRLLKRRHSVATKHLASGAGVVESGSVNVPAVRRFSPVTDNASLNDARDVKVYDQGNVVNDSTKNFDLPTTSRNITVAMVKEQHNKEAKENNTEQQAQQEPNQPSNTNANTNATSITPVEIANVSSRRGSSIIPSAAATATPAVPAVDNIPGLVDAQMVMPIDDPDASAAAGIITSNNNHSSQEGKVNEESAAKTSTEAAAVAGPSTSSQTAEDDKDKEEDKDAKKKKNRCAECRKKVGLTGFQCRCGGLYCAVHRYSDKHDCTFNYREHGAQEIRRNNPVVVGEKIQKI